MGATGVAHTFLRLNLSAILLFATLYYLQDKLLTAFPRTSHAMRLLKHPIRTQRSNSMGYYLWFSLMTQTTVGYTATIDADTGKMVHFSQIESRAFVACNVAQMLSVLGIAAYMLHVRDR